MFKSPVLFVALLLVSGSVQAGNIRACGFFSVMRDYSNHRAFHLITRTGNDYVLEANTALTEKKLADGESVCFTLNVFERTSGPIYQVAMDEAKAEKKSRYSTQVYEE